MWLRRLEIENFRNVAALAVELCPGFNFFYGANGAGKTAILESVHVLARGRSFRTGHLDDLIRTGQQGLVIRAIGQDEHVGTQRVALARKRGGGTEILVNGESGRRMSQLSVLFPMEVMTPSMSDLVFGGPALRREWLDWGVFHVKHEYLGILRRFSAALRQRNAGLRGVATGRIKPKELDPWSQEVARLGSLVSTARMEHLEDIRSRIAANLSGLGGRFELEIRYRPGWPDGEDLANVLGENIAREVKSGATIAGPHRADLELRVEGQTCSTTLSRGQAKVLASALMLAQADVIRAGGSRTGLFLIDDIGAELDSGHRRRLFQALVERNCQVLATSVEQPEPEVLAQCPTSAMFHVEHGQILIR